MKLLFYLKHSGKMSWRKTSRIEKTIFEDLKGYFFLFIVAFIFLILAVYPT